MDDYFCYLLFTVSLYRESRYGSINSRWYGEHVLRSSSTWCSSWNLDTTMLFLCTALDLLQNGGITSGNDIFFVVFWTLHDTAKNLVMMFLDEKLNVCFRNSLAACGAFASEFGRFWYNFVFPGCACRLSTTNQTVCLPNCVLHFFWKLHDVFQLFHGQGERFWNLWWVGSYLRMFWKWWWIQPTWIHQWEAECFWCAWNLCDSAATLKTGQVQEDQHSTVHAAWTANLLRFVSCLEKSWATGAVEAVVLGFLCFFKHATWRRPTPLRALATSGCN